jgi:serpin B
MHATPLTPWKRHGRRSGTDRRRTLYVERLEDRRMLAGRAADAVNAFAFDLYEQMQREQGNLFFSPLSIATSLAMAYAGAAGQTATEMEQVLHLGTEPGIHDSFSQLMASLNDVSSPFGPTLTVANAMWPQMGFPVNPAFIDTITNDYRGHLQALDYGNPDAAEETINNWVEEATKGKIQDLVTDLTPATKMVLTNSVYFKAFWEQPFDRDRTSPQDFTLDDGSVISTPIMRTDLPEAVRTVIDGFSVLEMPFDGGFQDADLSMVFVLPPRTGNREMSSEVYAKIDDWLNGPKFPYYSELWLPKFKTEVSTSLNDVLAGLGMPTAFELGAADFSGMMPGVAISNVFHKTFLELNEEGTEAAAATQVEFAICFAKGTPVLTPQGERPIDELQVGDLVLARDEGNLEGELLPKRIEAVFRNEAAIVELRVGGQVIRTTAEHPFFVRRRGWTAAAEIRPSDSVSTSAAGWIAVDDVRATSETVPVYNMRVADYHTYFVGSAKWGFAVWVHNSCVDTFLLDRSFHLLIRDNATSTILFMGRINDPTQLENEVTPSVVQASADFDGNSFVDGNDFLMWQRGLGRTSGAAKHDGDGDGDGDVDAADFGYWAGAFGQTPASPPSALSAVAANSPSSERSLSVLLSAELRDAAFYLNSAGSEGPATHARFTRPQSRPDLDALEQAFDESGLAATPSHRAAVQGSLWSLPAAVEALDDASAADSLANSTAERDGVVGLPPTL